MSTDSILNGSPFQPFLGGNTTIPDSELFRLRELLEKPVEELKVLDKEVEGLERVLEDRLAHRTHLHSSLLKYETLLNPVRSLPKEVLQHIFVSCLPPHPHLPALDRKVAPLLLTRVCRGWRKVALGTPRLWQSLHIVIQQGSRPFLKFHMGRVNRWLTAAQDEPLTISIWSKGLPLLKDLDILVDNILSHSAHIQTLKFDSLDHSLVYLFADSLPGEAWPMLRKVALIWLKDSPTPLDIAELPIWRAPLLTAIEWNSVTCDLWGTGIRWDSLEELEVYQETKRLMLPWTRFGTASARAMVQSTPNIRRLQLTLEDQLSQDSVPRGPTGPIELKNILVLPHLTVLNLTDFYHPTTPSFVFLEGLQLPALEVLQYDLVQPGGLPEAGETQPPFPPNEDHPLVKFLRGQQAPVDIKTFEVDIDCLSLDALAACLKMAPLTERLWIKDRTHTLKKERYHRTTRGDEGGADKGLFEVLMRSTRAECRPRDGESSEPADDAPQLLCPRLTNLQIAYIKCELEDVEAFVDARLSFSEALNATTPPSPGLNYIQIYATCERPQAQSDEDDSTPTGPFGTRPDPLDVKTKSVEEALGARGVQADLNFSTSSSWLDAVSVFRRQVPKKFNPWQGLVDKRDEERRFPEHDWS